MKKLIIGILVSIIFIYFSLRGVEYRSIPDSFKEARFFYLIPTVIFSLLGSILRSLRWGVILSPIKKISQRKLFPISCVGHMASIIIPMKIGELYRLYLLKKESGISKSSSLATIFLERVFDILILCALLYIIIFYYNTSLPSWFNPWSTLFLPLFVLLLVIIFLYSNKARTSLAIVNPFLSRLSPKHKARVEEIAHNFSAGFQIIKKPGRLIQTLILSLLLWTSSVMVIYTLFYFHNLELPLPAALTILIFTVIGISLPTGPGFLGNFQFSCVLALSLFSLPKGEAVMFSLVYYFISVVVKILLGLAFLPSLNISFINVLRNSSEVGNEERIK